MSSRFWRFWACFVAANSDRWRSWWPLPQIDDPSRAGVLETVRAVSASGPRRSEASFLVEPLAVPTRVPPILLEPLRVAVPAPRPLVLPVPAANELVQLWYAAGIQAKIRLARPNRRDGACQVQAARRLNATRRQMLLDMWRRVAGFENTEGALLLRLGVL